MKTEDLIEMATRNKLKIKSTDFERKTKHKETRGHQTEDTWTKWFMSRSITTMYHNEEHMYGTTQQRISFLGTKIYNEVTLNLIKRNGMLYRK